VEISAAGLVRHEWAAHYLDGQTAIRYPATVRLMREGLEVTTASGWVRLWPYRDIRQTQGFYKGEEARLERGGELAEAVIVSDPAFLHSLHEAAPTAAGFHDPAGRGRRVRLTVLAGVAVIGITAALYLWGIPLLAALAAPRVPVAWEESLGRAVTDQLAPPDRLCADPGGQRALDTIVARLTAAASPSPYTFRARVVNVADVNALAAPGGYLVLFRGLVERARTPDELAGVLAHEIEHVLHRHATRAVIQLASTGLLLAALTGDMTGPLAYGLESARVLGQLQYSRHAEEEADRDGMRLLLAARVAPDGMIGFFDELAKGEHPRRVLRYLSTHPSPRDRIGALRALAARAPGAPTPVLTDQQWQDLKAICSTAPVMPSSTLP
jgi:Zn-dependent protease with chaperone function